MQQIVSTKIATRKKRRFISPDSFIETESNLEQYSSIAQRLLTAGAREQDKSVFESGSFW